MLLYLIRHGQSVANVAPASAEVDCALTTLGDEQARLVAQWLVVQQLTHVYTSPYRRTVATARAIGREVLVPPQLLPSVHEHHGVRPNNWNPPTLTELRLRYADLLVAEEVSEEGWCRLPETSDLVYERMVKVVEWIQMRHTPESRVAVVSHASPIQQIIAAVTQAYTPAHAASLVVGNASVTLLDLRSTPTQALYIGKSDFLQAHEPVLL
ncbi:MAG: histidine phosphatase family protein [Chloroflexi bacterium]|nr:histidine phosphatase family protein [Chloroflexota bacterium]